MTMATNIKGTIYSSNTGEPYYPKEGDMTRLWVEVPAAGYTASWVTFTDKYDSSACRVDGIYNVKVPPGTGTIRARADVQQPDGSWKTYDSQVYSVTLVDGVTTMQDIQIPVPAEKPPTLLEWLIRRLRRMRPRNIALKRLKTPKEPGGISPYVERCR